MNKSKKFNFAKFGQTPAVLASLILPIIVSTTITKASPIKKPSSPPTQIFFSGNKRPLILPPGMKFLVKPPSSLPNGATPAGPIIKIGNEFFRTPAGSKIIFPSYIDRGVSKN